MPSSDIAADHALVRDVLPHLSAQVRLDLDFPEAVNGLRLLRLRYWLCERRGHVVWCSKHMGYDRG